MKKTILYLLIILPAAVFLLLSLLFTQNIPYNDDFPSILGFLNDFGHSSGIGEKISLLFSPYGEHRIFFVRAITLAQKWISGTVNFSLLAAIGNIAFVIAFVYMVKSFKPKEKKLLYIIPAAFLFFQLQSWSNNIWAMASLSNTLIFCWIMMSLYFLFKDGQRNFIAGILFALLATYTNGNGVFVLFTAAVTFFFMKSYKKGGATLSLFVLLFLLNNHSASGSLTEKLMHQGIGRIAGMFFVFLGSNFFHPSYMGLGIACGVAFTLYFAYLFFFRKYYNVNPIFCSLYLLIFLTAFAVATQRDILDIATAAPSRYRIYCTLLLVISYFSIAETVNDRRLPSVIKFIVLPVSVLFCIASDFIGTSKLENRKELTLTSSFLLNNNLYFDHYRDSIYHFSIEQGFIEAKIVSPATLCMPVHKPMEIAEPQNALYRTDYIVHKNGFMIVKGWAGLQDTKNNLNKPYIIVHKGNTTSIYKANFLEVPEFINDKAMLPYATCGYLASVPQEACSGADSISIAISRDVRSGKLLPLYAIGQGEIRGRLAK